MKTTSNTLFIAVVSLAVLSSCMKDDKPASSANETKTPKQILMSYRWKKAEYRENGTITPFFASCEMDDVIGFTASDWVLEEGANKCSMSTSSDYYLLESDNKTMHWMYGSGELTINASAMGFSFKRTGATTFEYSFTRY